jgi:hypothetical protein
MVSPGNGWCGLAVVPVGSQAAKEVQETKKMKRVREVWNNGRRHEEDG